MNPMRDQNGQRLRIGATARYCGDLFEIIGQEGSHAVCHPIDPEVGMHLRIPAAELLREEAPSLWRTLLGWMLP